jgi:uncharacterized membrane protein YhfC
MHSPSPLFALAGVGMIAVAAAALLLAAGRRRSLWAAAGIGAGAWAIAVALKLAWAIPMNPIVWRGLDRALGKSAGGPFFWLYVGLLTGVFECGVTLLLVRRTRLRSAAWDEAAAFGAGFGATEALLLGVAQVVAVAATIAFFDGIPADQKQAVAKAYGHPTGAFLPVVERVTAVIAHAFSCVLIVFGVRLRRQRWFWSAFAYKTALDGFAAWAVLSFGVKESVVKMAEFEAMVAAFAVVGVAGLAWLRRPAYNGTNPRRFDR